MQDFSYKQMIVKGIKYFTIFGLSAIVTSFVSTSPFANITVGAVAVMFVNWLKVKVGVNFVP